MQSEYSIWERDVEDDILAAYWENGIGFVPHSPLGRGLLAGSIRSLDELPANDSRRNDPRYSPENMPKNLAIVDAIAEVAGRHGVSNAQVALAWLLGQGDDIVPIPGVKRRETMSDSVGAPEVGLTAADFATIEAAAPSGTTAGPQYAEAGMARVKLKRRPMSAFPQPERNADCPLLAINGHRMNPFENI